MVVPAESGRGILGALAIVQDVTRSIAFLIGFMELGSLQFSLLSIVMSALCATIHHLDIGYARNFEELVPVPERLDAKLTALSQSAHDISEKGD